jgi:hypothetical protein
VDVDVDADAEGIRRMIGKLKMSADRCCAAGFADAGRDSGGQRARYV